MNFFGSSEPSGPTQLTLAKIEAEVLSDMFNKMGAVCFKKCVVQYNDTELQVGEMTCIDRCVGKYMQAGEKVESTLKAFEERMNAQQQATAATASKLGIK